MSKIYAPVRVHNPFEGHTVPLMPNQNFILSLSGEKNEIDCRSQYFSLEDVVLDKVKHRENYFFKQKYDLTTWSFVSRLYLGQVLTLADTQFGGVCAYLNANTKARSGLLTVVNPINETVKASVTTILQVVIYDELSMTWDCKVREKDLRYEVCKYKIITPEQARHCHLADDDPEDTFFNVFPRSYVTSPDKKIVEHHFWLRLSNASLIAAFQAPVGTFDAGILSFTSPTSRKNFKLGVTVQNRSKTKMDAADSYEETKSKVVTKSYPKHTQTYSYKASNYNSSYYNSLNKQVIHLQEKSECEFHGSENRFF